MSNIFKDIIWENYTDWKIRDKNILREEIIKALKKSEQEIENREGIESDEGFKKLRQKYEYEV